MIVSIPHRYAKNLHPLPNMAPGGDVSIPHRYAKNYVTQVGEKFIEAFQFLIGTLKTARPAITNGVRLSFNSS